MKGVIRIGLVAVAVLSCLGCAYAQQKELISAPLPNLPANRLIPYVGSFQQNVLSKTALRRSWYWEAIDLTQPLSGANKYLPRGVTTSNSDFSPASLQWTFTGKRKLMPTLDLTLVKIKPGEGTIHDGPDAQTGAAGSSRSSLWDRATQSISDLLHTE